MNTLRIATRRPESGSRLVAVELEENLRRKDLTPYELSKVWVERAEVVAEIDKRELSEVTSGKSKRGRPVQPGSVERIAERLGVANHTIHNARNHVAAVESYPELESLTQTDAPLEQIAQQKKEPRHLVGQRGSIVR